MKWESILALERNAGRLKDIVSVLAKYGLADWLSHVEYDWLRSRLKSFDGQHLQQLKAEERIRLALTELGTTFIKLGQMLSTRPDLVGPDLAKELSKLQSDTPADDPGKIASLIQQELGREPEALFAEFEPQPFASASIAQVHHATLHSGEEVVVKIQHAEIEKRVYRDLDILLGLAELAQRHSSTLKLYQPVATVRQFRRMLKRELDFNHERRNLEVFQRNFNGDETIHFPDVFPAYCSRRVLTMERLIGIQGTETERLLEAGQDLDEFVRSGANMYLNMIFRDGFYHADPHAGNLMMLPDNVVGVIDCGMTGRVDEQLRDEIESLLLAALNRDAQELTEIVWRIGSVPPDCPRDQLRAEVTDFLDELVGVNLRNLNVSEALNGLTGIIRRFHVVLPSSLSMLLKVLVMLEGTSRRLDPNFSLAELMQPYCSSALQRRLSPVRMWKRVHRSIRDWERFLDSLPRDLSDIVTRVRSGTFNVNLAHRHLEPSINRLVMGIFTASLFLGSSALWSFKAPPLIGEISIFGALGYAASLWLGFRLLRAIRKTGDMKERK